MYKRQLGLRGCDELFSDLVLSKRAVFIIVDIAGSLFSAKNFVVDLFDHLDALFRRQAFLRATLCWTLAEAARSVVTHSHSTVPAPAESTTAHTSTTKPVSYTHLRAHETVLDLVCRLLLEKKKLHSTRHIIRNRPR